MHYYSFDTEIRRYVYVFITLISSSIPTIFKDLTVFWHLPNGWSLLATFGTCFALLYFLFDHLIWKLLKYFNLVLNLNGNWIASGESSYLSDGTPHKFSMKIKIKQTFTKIEIHTETENSISRSTMASISLDHAFPIFRYSFENTPINKSNSELQRHPGLIELVIKKDLMEGDYFSGKHRLNYGSLRVTRI